jgi:hypothetical protein
MVDHTDIKDKLRRFFKIQGNATISREGVVDVNGNVTLTSLWRKLPVKFNRVTGFFICTGSQLTTLAGCPTHVGDTFDCSGNQLDSLEYAPVHVGKHFRCSDNQLTSLAHAPQAVQGYFSCAKNKLTNLMHAPTYVNDNFTCHGNPLVSLGGAPEHVGKTWWLTYESHLPLLRTLGGSEIQFMNITTESDQVAEILNKYTGQGKAGAIKAAVDLVRAGFKENAKW